MSIVFEHQRKAEDLRIRASRKKGRQVDAPKGRQVLPAQFLVHIHSRGTTCGPRVLTLRGRGAIRWTHVLDRPSGEEFLQLTSNRPICLRLWMYNQ